MTETKLKNKHPFMLLAQLVTPRINYVKIRGYFQLLSIFFIIAAMASLGSHGAIIHTIAYGLFASLMFNFANKCDSILTRHKIEQWLNLNSPVFDLEKSNGE